MTDLERVKQYHDWLGDKYEIETAESTDNFYQFYNMDESDYNQRLIVGERGYWYWTYYIFKDGKLVQHWISE